MRNLISRDFKIRYRNMSLGVFWSLLNPLVMMAVLTFVFTRIFPNVAVKNFHISILSGLVIFNFFSLSWQSATVSIYGNSGLIKRVPLARELLPVATVLANSLHFLIQIGLLVFLALLAGYAVNAYWLLLPVIFALEIVFVCGLALVTSALDVYFRDVRYVVESANTVLFWLVPIFYSFAMIPPEYRSVYQYNPVAAVVLACRAIIMEGRMPPESLLVKLPVVSVSFLALGFLLFRRLQRKFADYL
ncbi:MAG: ABC transporter permease [Bryobacteraceae bacterium]|nr:ABC transporter permease [Bryobacteraceae bacterium]